MSVPADLARRAGPVGRRGAVLAIVLMAAAFAAATGPDDAFAAITTDGRRPTAVESMARVPTPPSRPTLRCWQYGRLVYEATDVQLVRESLVDGRADGGDGATGAGIGAGLVSNPGGGTGVGLDAERRSGGAGRDGRRRVRVLDLNQGLCIID